MNIPDFLNKLKVADCEEAIKLVDMLKRGEVSGMPISPLDVLPNMPTNGILSLDKSVIRDKFYLVEQAKSWLLWHGTLDRLKGSFLCDLRRMEYTRTDDSDDY